MSATAPRHVLRDVPIGTGATGTRLESDSMGQVEVPAEHYWGAQTQRSLIHFSIGDDHMPKAVYHAYGYVKKAAAQVNEHAGRLDGERAQAIVKAAEEVIGGSSTPSSRCMCGRPVRELSRNMNVNEVIANRASQLLEASSGRRTPCTPTTTSTWGNPRTTRSPPRCTSRHCWRS